MKKRSSSLAHRGYSAKYPENTLIALEEGFKYADGIEIDVHFTQDKQLVVIHDETVDRTTNGEGVIKDMLLTDIQRLDAGSWKDKAFSEQKIPTLREVFDLYQVIQSQKIINIEIKTDVFEYTGIEYAILELVEMYSMEDNIIISSFNYDTLVRIKKLNGHIKIGYLINGPSDDLITKLETLKPDALHSLYFFGFQKVKEYLDKMKMKLRIYTINDAAEYQYLLKLGVDAIFTDDMTLIDGKEELIHENI